MKERGVSGGRVNKVEGLETTIKKKYFEGGIVKGLGLSARQRWKNETVALSLYGSHDFKPLRVPRIVSSDEDALQITMERLQAVPVEDLIRKDISFFMKENAKKLAQVLKAIHSPCKEVNQNLHDTYCGTFKSFIDSAAPILEKEQIDSEQLKVWMATALKGLKDRTDAVPVHTDFWFENILSDEEGDFYVIDWEFYGVGTPYEDLGVFYANVYEHFPELNEFCKDFFRVYAQNVNIELVRAFAVYRCLRLLSHVDIEDYDREPLERPHSFKEMMNIVRRNIARPPLF